MEIRVLGPGCARCHEVEKRTRDALAELDVAADLQKITDMKEIMGYGIMGTPGLVINGMVRCAARIPSVAEIKKWIQEALRP